MKSLNCAVLTAALLLLNALGRAEQPQESAVSLKIEAASMEQALNEFAQQTGLQLVFPAEEVTQGLAAPQLDGSFTPRAALERLLANSGLYYQFINTNTVAIRSKASEGVTGRRISGTLAGKAEDIRLAQTEGAGSTEAAASTQSTRDSAATAPEEKLEEIIVTAQKRVERLQEVPISISVLSGADLDRSTAQGISEALNRVPGVSTSANFLSGGTTLAVRGVTASGAQFAGATPVGYYLDSIPFGLTRSTIVPDSSAYDLQQVEVLRGPQGTLYGASALNGVVRVLTQDADLNEFEFKARGSVSSTADGDESYRADLAANAPLIAGKLGARVVLGHQDIGGWIDRPGAGLEDVNGGEVINARVKLNAQPTDDLSMALLAWVSRSEFDAGPTAAAPDVNTSTVREPSSTDYNAFGLRAAYDFTHFTLTSMTSYLTFDQDSYADLFSSLNGQRVRLLTDFDSTVFAQEIVLSSSNAGAWRWQLGGMYRDAEDDIFQFRINRILVPGGSPIPIDWTDASESTAVFGEAMRLFLDGKLELTAGLRYFEDKVTMQENQKADGSANPLLLRESTFTATTPRVVVTAHPNRQHTVYASYSEGFRSGFDQTPIALSAVPGIPPVKPDSLRNYEIGAKGNLFAGRLAYESAVYYTDWEDIQQILSVLFLGAPTSVVTNAGTASGLGVDLSLSTQPTDGLELGLTLGWNDLSFDENVFTTVIDNTLVPPGPRDIALFSAGDRISLSPEYTAGVWADYSFPLGGAGYRGLLSASANFTSEYENRAVLGTAVTLSVGGDILTSRLSLGIEAPQNWSATLFADNLNDDRDIVVGNFFAERSIRVRPRTVGLQFEYRF